MCQLALNVLSLKKQVNSLGLLASISHCKDVQVAAVAKSAIHPFQLICQLPPHLEKHDFSSLIYVPFTFQLDDCTWTNIENYTETPANRNSGNQTSDELESQGILLLFSANFRFGSILISKLSIHFLNDTEPGCLRD